jgi:alpha-glucosidase
MHDEGLRDNPPRPPADGVVPAKPFALQHHLHDMLQPGIMPLLGRIRGLMDRYPGTATLAEVSSQDGAFERVARYTEGSEALHMAYTLRPLRGAFDRPTLLGMLREVAVLGGTGAVCWSFSNHDVERAVSRWNPRRGTAEPDPAFARMLMALLLSLPGSVSIFQGEELGLTEAELRFEDLRDPFGITYWPEFRGRDGSRTPMPWRRGAPHAGFTAAPAPWLPVPPAHHALAVDAQEADAGSLLHEWRRFLRWRREQPALRRGGLRPLDLPAPLVGFERMLGDRRLLAIFNPGEAPARFERTDDAPLRPLAGHGFSADWTADAVLLPPYGVLFAEADAAAARRTGALLAAD